MAIWQEDNPLRERLKAKVGEVYGNTEPIETWEPYESMIRSELGEEVYDFHRHNSDAFPVEYKDAPYEGTCMTCGEPIKEGNEIVSWVTYGLYKV